MTIGDALKGSGIAKSEAELLIAHALRMNRTHVLAHPEQELTTEEAHLVTDFITRRRKGEPMGYLLQHVEFYGRMFKADSRALIPRTPTESIVEMALSFIHAPKNEIRIIDTGIIGWSHVLRQELQQTVVIDIGTGAGCIAITLKLEKPDLHIIGSDISAEALELAKENADELHADVEWKVGDGADVLHDLTEPFLLVSNPPYIPKDRSLAKEVSSFEPHVALFGGEDGMELLKVLINEAKNHPQCAGFILECEEAQQRELMKLL